MVEVAPPVGGEIDDDGQRIARTVVAIAHAERLVMLGVLAQRALTTGELAFETGLDPAVVGDHLAVLGRASLISARKDGHRRLLGLRRETLAELAETCEATMRRSAEADQAESTVPLSVRPFFAGRRLLSFPARQSRKIEVLRVLIEDFQRGIDYPEAEVSRILSDRHPDFATLRRAMIDEGLMTRRAGIYRRTT